MSRSNPMRCSAWDDEPDICSSCGSPLDDDEENLCAECSEWDDIADEYG